MTTQPAFGAFKRAAHPLPLISTVLLAALGAALALACSSSQAQAYPKPSIYQLPGTWELKFQHDTPKRIAVAVPGSNVPKAFWYITFLITNETGDERDFFPAFDLVTQEGVVIHSEKDVPANVFTAIKDREGKKALEPLSKLTGRKCIKQGDDQAREGVAIWPAPTERMDTFDIFCAGLSSEACIVKDGKEIVIDDWTKESPEDRAKQVILYKTTHMSYRVQGDDIHPEENAVVQTGQDEAVMR